jgi:hypothetical protein
MTDRVLEILVVGFLVACGPAMLWGLFLFWGEWYRRRRERGRQLDRILIDAALYELGGME